MNPMIRLKSVNKEYKGKIILRDINMEVHKGSIHAIVGPNAAGKTTILKIITGFTFPTRGEVFVDGPLGFLPESKALYGEKSVKDMLRLAEGLTPFWQNETMEDLLGIFNLDMDKEVGELSFGKRTQLFLVILFSQDVPLYILDEPTLGLDPIISNKVFSIIRQKVIQGKTVLYSSHNLSDIEELADEITIMRKGVILYSGELDALRERLDKNLKEAFLYLMEEEYNEGFKKRAY